MIVLKQCENLNIIVFLIDIIIQIMKTHGCMQPYQLAGSLFWHFSTGQKPIEIKESGYFHTPQMKGYKYLHFYKYM